MYISFLEFFYSPSLLPSCGVEKAPIKLDMQLAIAVGFSCIGCWRGALAEAVGAGVASSGGRGRSVTVLLLAALRYRSRCGLGCSDDVDTGFRTKIQDFFVNKKSV